MKNFISLALLAVTTLAAVPTRAQSILPRSHIGSLPHPHRALASHIIIPQARPWAVHSPAGTAQIIEVNVAVEIVEQVATTTLDISLTNVTGARLEAEMAVPVPDKAVLRGFTFQGAASEPAAELLSREDARKIYDSIVAQTRDPALLEFIGCNLIRSSVFPVEPRGAQKVRLIYEQVLPADGERVDYVLPRTESVDYRVPWKVAVRIKSKQPIAAVYSPSHKLDTARTGVSSVTTRIAADATTEPGSFRLSYLLQKNGLTASLLAYPDPKIGGGYFLLLAGAPSRTGVPPVPNNQDGSSAYGRPTIRNAPSPSGTGGTPVLLKREVILVLDRSGSMAGEKLEQARAAALQVLEGLEDGEAFNIIIYHEGVESFAPDPVIKNTQTMRAARAYLRDIRVRGGTNIHDALVEALRMRLTHGCLPIVLFLTDGLPTVGQTSEKAIREAATKANLHERRIFTFGVGVDVNTPLLDRIAVETRAVSTFVLPREDVEVKVGQVFKRLVGPVLASPTLEAARSSPHAPRVREVTPVRLPDLFEGDQLVVLGQYVGEEPLAFQLRGNYFGEERSFRFNFELAKATTMNSFIPRLWASRKIAALTDAIRDLGADRGAGTSAPTPADPRVQELVDEVVRLSKEFGILTEYTAFLAREGSDLAQPALVAAEALKNFDERAVKTRSGYGSVNQSLNGSEQRDQQCVKLRNDYWDANLNRVSVGTVQQVNDRAFYKRGNRWVDSALVDKASAVPRRTVEFGSDEFRQLAAKLAAQNRQGCIALSGEILLQVDGESVLVR